MLFDDLAIISIKFGNQFDYFGLVQNKVHYILEKGQAPAMFSLNALLFIKPISIFLGPNLEFSKTRATGKSNHIGKPSKRLMLRRHQSSLCHFNSQNMDR